MTRDDVINLFKSWRGAGLRPPMDKNSVEQANNMVDAFLKQYSALTHDEVQMLSVKLARLQFWPRFYDVDEALADYRTQKSTQVKSSAGTESLEGRAKRNEEVRVMLGLAEDHERVNYVELMAERYAAKHYPEASAEFVFNNRLNLAAMFEAEWECDNCAGKMSKDCKYGCHTPYIHVDKYTGYAEMLSDSMKCDRHIENPNSFHQAEGGQKRGGGFNSFGDVVG